MRAARALQCGRCMKLHHLFIVIGIISSGAGRARAEEHDGWAIGARVEGFVYGAGADYWRDRLGVTATVAGAASSQSESAPGWPTSEAQSTVLGGSLGGLFALAEGQRARLALGARAVYERQHLDFGDAGAWTFQTLSLQVPLRIQVWVADRVALHTELGIELGLGGTRTIAADGGPAGEGDNRYVALFGHPLGNFGVSYCF
jgi:hypothetical protein